MEWIYQTQLCLGQVCHCIGIGDKCAVDTSQSVPSIESALALWLRQQTFTVRIWLLCNAARVGRPGSPWGQTAQKWHNTNTTQHDNKIHSLHRRVLHQFCISMTQNVKFKGFFFLTKRLSHTALLWCKMNFDLILTVHLAKIQTIVISYSFTLDLCSRIVCQYP